MNQLPGDESESLRERRNTDVPAAAGGGSARRGQFLVLEGADGCGKSTQARRLAEVLGSQGREVLHVRDPGSTHLAESVRRVLLDPSQGHIAVAAEMCLYLAARAQLAEEVLVPALARGAFIVCERWTLSTEVYQGDAGGFGAASVRKLAHLACGGVAPDLVLVLDVPVGAGLARLGRDRDRMERKGDDFHARVVRSYRRLARRRRGCVLLPHAPLDDVTARIGEEVARRVR